MTGLIMHRNHSVSFLFACLVSLSALGYSGPSSGPSSTKRTASVPDVIRYGWLDVGRVKMNVTNLGGNNCGEWGNGGGFWPDIGFSNLILFDFGPWVIGKVNGSPAMGCSVWGSSYSPGPIIHGKAAMNAAPEDSLRYRVFRISHGDSSGNNPDYRDWPASLGAPVDAQGHPRLYGNQTVWTQFNDLDSNAFPNGWSMDPKNRIPRLPIEIQQTIFGQAPRGGDTTALLANVAFLEWTIINKGNVTIDSAYFSLWADIDFNGAENNTPAVDTVNQVGYCWQPYDTSYGGYYIGVPRAVGFVLLYGPSVDSVGSRAVFQGRSRENARNLPMTSFWGIIDDSPPDSSFFGPAKSTGTAWNIARGYDKLGQVIVDSATGQVTKFAYNGDPITGQGWLWSRTTGGGAGFNMFSGPFTMAPNDTQWVMAALVPAENADRLTCVYLLQRYAAILRSMPYSAFVDTSYVPPSPPPPPPFVAGASPITLQQNYPNPFNSATTITYTVPFAGSHPIGSDGAWAPNALDVRLIVADVLGRQVAVLVNEWKAPGLYAVDFDATDLASGTYFYRLETAGQVEVKKMVLLR